MLVDDGYNTEVKRVDIIFGLLASVHLDHKNALTVSLNSSWSPTRYASVMKMYHVDHNC